MVMARASSGLAYPERFFAAAAYAGFDGSPNSSVTSKFSNDVALLLYGLYQQATVGPCKIPKPRSWSPVEQNKWTRSHGHRLDYIIFGEIYQGITLFEFGMGSGSSWNGLDNMASTEAMRLFVKILEEEDPGWYSRASNFVPEPVQDIEMNSTSLLQHK